jgi:hypothetical protein
VLWLAVLWLVSSGFGNGGKGLWSFVLLVPWVVYELAVNICQRVLGKRGQQRAPLTLCLVGGGRAAARRDQLADELARNWGYLGPVSRLHQVCPRLGELEVGDVLKLIAKPRWTGVVGDVATLGAALEGFDLGPDPDGRFRMNRLIAPAPTVWREALTRLARSCDVAVVDARRFSAANAENVRETLQVIDVVSLNRLIFVADKTTDQTLLEDELRKQWQELAAGSPNQLLERPVARVFHVEALDEREIKGLLLLLLDSAAREGAASSRETSAIPLDQPASQPSIG